jgi:arylsulfatase A-like enzyme
MAIARYIRFIMKPRPHIVYILADDLGYGDLSCLNPESKIATPRHDRIAAEGMTFTDAHSNSAVCTPTRYGVLTGRYCWRGRLKAGVLGGYAGLLIEDGRPTVASLLQQAGYRTACIGKWHLGLGWQRHAGAADRDPWDFSNDDSVRYDRPLTAGPHTVGFDQSLIIPSSLDIPPYCYIDGDTVVEPPTAAAEESRRPAMWRAGPISPGIEHETCLLEFTRRAEQCIADHAARTGDEPLFLYLPLPSPHTPHVPRKPFRGTTAAGPYGDYVAEHDWSVGQVFDALARHGMAEDTLFIVTSDNGAHIRGGDFDFQREFGHRSNYHFRGQKSDAWDGGHRVPFLVRWPGRVQPGSTCDNPVCLTDLFATCAEVTGQASSGGGEDSVSLLPLFNGEPDGYTRDATVHHSVSGEFALRRGRWKYLECPGSGGWSSPKDAEAREQNLPGHQLYDMADDPTESRNVIGEQPDVADQLQQQLDGIRGDDHVAA